MIMNICKVKRTFLASIEFKTDTKEMTQKEDWVSELWSFTHWNILNEVMLDYGKTWKEFHNLR